MELRQLRYLTAIVEEANFTRAAEKAFVSQSALSQQIQALEQEVGILLLDRTKRGVRLTAGGEILHYHAQRIFQELEAAKVALQELQGLQRGDLKVGVVQTVNDYFIPQLVAAYASHYPQIKLVIDELSSDHIEAGLQSGALQVGLGFMPVTNPAIASEALFEESLVLIARRDHALAGTDTVPVHYLDAMPLIMLSNTFCTRRLWEEKARLAGASPNVVMEVNTVSSILALVEKTGLATVLPAQSLDEHWKSDLVSIRLVEPTPSRQVRLLWHGESYLCSASRAFIAVARRVGEKLGQQPG
jgi:LysR family cyn operon transcriptional activator